MNFPTPENQPEAQTLAAATTPVTSCYWYGMFMSADLTRGTERVSSFRFAVTAEQAKREMIEVAPEFPIGAIRAVDSAFRLPG